MESKPTLIWRQRAACRGADPDIFYPISDEDAEEAQAICAGCDVRHLCLEWALSNREHDGVWGAPPNGSVVAWCASVVGRPERPMPTTGSSVATGSDAVDGSP